MGLLGKDSKLLQIQAHIKDKFGVEMSPNHISASKTEVLREMAGGTKPAAAKPMAPKPAVATPAAKTTTAPKPAAKKPTSKKPAASKPQAKPAPAAASNGQASGSVALADVVTVKALVGRIGATDLKTLIDLVAK